MCPRAAAHLSSTGTLQSPPRGRPNRPHEDRTSLPQDGVHQDGDHQTHPEDVDHQTHPEDGDHPGVGHQLHLQNEDVDLSRQLESMTMETLSEVGREARRT